MRDVPDFFDSSDYTVTIKSSGVMYLEPNNSVHAPFSSIEVFFPGFIIDTKRRPHLSIHQHFIDSKSAEDIGLLPYHCTFVLIKVDDPNIYRVLHGYYNLHGMFVDFQLKEYDARNNSKDGAHIFLPYSRKKEMQPLVESYSRLLTQLLLRKTTVYTNLHEQFDELVLAIHTHRSCSEKTQQTIEEIEKALTLLSTLDTYDNNTQRGRSRFLENFREELERLTISTVPEQSAESASDAEGSIAFSAQKKIWRPIKKLIQDISRLMSELEINNNDFQGVDATLAFLEAKKPSPEKMTELHDLFLALELDDSKNYEVKKFKQQNPYLFKIRECLSQAFTDGIEQGNLSQVELIYPYLIMHEKMQHHVDAFIKKIESCSEAEAQCLAPIGDFFDRVSELYRSTVFNRNEVLTYLPQQHRGHGLLMPLFLSGKLTAFRLFLRHGVRPDSIQCFYLNGKEHVLHNALQMVIAYFHVNADPVQLEFVRALFEHGASLSMGIMSSDIESIIHPHKKEGSRSEEHLIYFKWLQSIPNTFALALRMNNDCALKSELVSELAQHLDPSELLLEILALLNDASPRANLHSEKTINNIKTALLALMKTKFSSLDSESQHVLIHQIAEKNKTHTSFDVLCFLQQLVPLLNEPGLPEHDVMLRACCAIEAKHSQHPRKKENGYTQAWKYFVALPFEVRCEYRKQYSRLFNYLEQKNMPSAAEENSSRVFKPSVTSVRNELEKEPDDALEIVLRGSSPS